MRQKAIQHQKSFTDKRKYWGHGLTRHKDARSMLCDCPWMARFRKQLNDTWIITQLVDQHDGHQLEYINPAYPESRPLTAAGRETMLDLVRHSTASFNAIASVASTTHGLSLLGRDVYNRSYDYTPKKGTSTAKFIKTLQDEGYIYRVQVAMDNTLEALFFCKPQDVQKARLYGQMVIMDTNRFRLPLVNIVTVDHNWDTVRIALCFISSEQTSAYTWVLQQLKDIVFPAEAPKVIITDADKALMKSLTEVFPTTINQHCRWHIEQNIMKNCRKCFSSAGEFDTFMKQIQNIASSTESNCQEEELKQLRDKFPVQAVDYFFDQWWANGLCESWAEFYVRKYSNFGICTTTRVEGSLTATKIINRRGTERSQELSVIASNKNLRVRLDIRNQIDRKVVYGNIPISARDGVCRSGEEVAAPARRWRGGEMNPKAAIPRKGRPKGTRRLKTSAEIVQKASDRIEKIRRCGSCRRVGHDRRSCPKLSKQYPQGIESEGLLSKNDGKEDDEEGFTDHEDDNDDAAFEVMWADALSLM